MKVNLFISTSLVVTSLLISSCLKDEPLKLKAENYSPKQLSDGLRVSTPLAQKIDENELRNAYDIFYSNQLPLSKGLIVGRNGFIVSEAYSQNINDISNIDNIQSCTKSITALLIGIALNEKLIESINDPIFKYIPEYFDNDLRKRKISIRNCLTLQAGLAFSGNKQSEEMVNLKGSSLKFALGTSVIADTGTVFQYSDLVPQLLTGILNKVTPYGVEKYAEEKLFKPLGIKNYVWEKTDDGINIGAFSLFITSRDLAKIALMCCNNGNFNNTQIVPSSWISTSSKRQTLNVDYGYGFYIEPKGGYLMRGNGGQFVYILPSKNLVIIYTASPYTGQELWGNTDELIKIITTACK